MTMPSDVHKADLKADVCLISSDVGAVKAVVGGSGKIEGYAIRFNRKDQQGDIFSPDGEYGLDDLKTLPLLYHHGVAKGIGNKRLGTATLEMRADGIYARGQLDLADAQVRQLYDRIKEDQDRGEPVMAFSSGSTSRMVRKECEGGTCRIMQWPLCELSISPKAVSPENVVRIAAVKSLPPPPPTPAEHYRRIRALRRQLAEPDLSPTPSQPGDRKSMATDVESTLGDYPSLGEFARDLVGNKGNVGRMAAYDEDIKSLGLNVDAISEGGALVPPDVAEDLFRAALDLRQYPLAYASRRPTKSNVYSWPVPAEGSRVDGERDGGVQGYLIREGQPTTRSYPRFACESFRLYKLVVDVATTNELFDDAPYLDDHLTTSASEEIAFQVSSYMIRGTGAGQPNGVLGATASIALAAEGGQAAATIVAANVRKMAARVTPESRSRFRWFYHPTCEEQLTALGSGYVRYASPSEAEAGAAPFTLLGRPAWACEACEPLGSAGDLIAGDFSQYAVIARELKKKISMHLRFDYDESVFRLMLRFDGRPMWTKPKTPYRGTDTVSPFVTLAARP